MKHGVTRELFAYWSRLRGSRSAPERRDLDPAAIRGILRDTFILEVDSEMAVPAYPIRLSGTRLNALFLQELKGCPLRAMWRPQERAALLELLATVSDERSPVVVGLRTGPEGHRPIDLELLLLPLRHHGRTHARILGSIAPIEVPSWLGLLPVQPFSITSHRLIGADDVAAASPEDVPDAGSLQAPKRYGQFVLHYGGR